MKDWYRIRVYRKEDKYGKRINKKITDRITRFEDMSTALKEAKKLYKVDLDKDDSIRVSTVMNLPKEYRYITD